MHFCFLLLAFFLTKSQSQPNFIQYTYVGPHCSGTKILANVIPTEICGDGSIATCNSSHATVVSFSDSFCNGTVTNTETYPLGCQDTNQSFPASNEMVCSSIVSFADHYVTARAFDNLECPANVTGTTYIISDVCVSDPSSNTSQKIQCGTQQVSVWSYDHTNCQGNATSFNWSYGCTNSYNDPDNETGTSVSVNCFHPNIPSGAYFAKTTILFLILLSLYPVKIIA